ncbi:MAG: response regulator [Candidatus Omnitrophica bacterium]|nr:response regulator [Candidatus Omnitrophota bacterium]
MMPERNKKIKLIAGGIAIVVALGGLILGRLVRHGRVEFEERVDAAREKVLTAIYSQQQRLIAAIGGLAAVPAVRAVPEAGLPPETAAFLRQYARATGIRAGFVLDAQGEVRGFFPEEHAAFAGKRLLKELRGVRRALAGEHGTEFMLSENGTPASLAASPLRDAQGDVRGVIGGYTPFSLHDARLSPDMFYFIVDRQGTIAESNAAGAAGVSLWPLAWPPDAAQKIALARLCKYVSPAAFLQPLIRHEPLGGDLRGLVMVAAPFSLHWYWGFGAVMILLLSGLGGLFLYVLDQRYRYAENLRMREQRFREMFDHMRSGVMVLTVTDNGQEFVIKEFNRAAETIERRNRAEVLGRRLGEIFPSFHEVGLVEILRRVWMNGIPETHPFTYYREHRIWSWRETYVYKISSRDLVMMYDDVTAQKRAEEELQMTQNRLKTIYENSAVAIMLADENEQLVSWNAYTETMLGFSEVDLRQRSVQTLYPAEEWQKIRAQNVRQKGMQHHLETKMFTRTGLLDVDISLSVVRDAQGRLLNSIAIVRDISARKQAETAMQEARRIAEEASEMKTRFLASMSHEIRTPMNSIVGYAELLAGTMVDEVQRKYMQTILDGCNLLLGIINDILDFSKIEAGNLLLEHIDFDLHQLIESTFNMIKPRLQGKSVEFFCEYADALPRRFTGDPTRLRQVLLNLLSNAVKFTEQGEVRLRVSAAAPEQGKTRMEIFVRDTGIGIPLAKQPYIFKPFMQADPSTARRFGGSGLGLAICKSLVERMGGAIGFRSQEGVGSEFFFTLFLDNAESGEPEGPAAVSAGLVGKRVVIVEDHPAARDLLKQYCEEQGLVVAETFPDAESALDWLKQQSSAPDILLSDIVLKGMDGYELARAVRSELALEKMKIIATTQDTNIGTAFLSRQYGFSAFLTKPIFKNDLVKTLESLFAGEPASRDPADNPEEFKNLRILIVDDNPINYKLLEALIRRFGCATDIADSGGMAIEKIRYNRYDIVLMDVQMPQMDGLAATRIIRTELANPVPIVGVSAAATLEDRETAIAGGMDDYITKPIDSGKIRKLFRQWGQRGAQKET